ncbi:hypothetical protein NLJ89_g10486 [Agrocybe chaxingu]|uniref:Uncharacterized protein n=1 Tax=Agrocybe chaxingu TaxID=84603 RepID=A0A9W8JQI4_9AGAR|nr:hypothetical protein NLJ89_g10486 [Agrocybe chaxingu]
MPPASVNTMPRAIEPPPSIDVHGFRDFVPDEDAANFNSALWETIDQDAFIRAQQEAIEAFNIAKALKVSQKTAAQEQQMRNAAAADAPVAVALSSASASTSAATMKPVATSTTTSMTTTTTTMTIDDQRRQRRRQRPDRRLG